MTSNTLQIVTTEDGSHTLYNPELKEHYHSIHGAVRESNHVFIRNGFDIISKKGQPSVKILEAGFGTGLNALLSFLKAEEVEMEVFYTAVELFPVDKKIISALNYPEILKSENANNWFSMIHEAGWDQMTELKKGMSIQKSFSSLLNFSPLINTYDVVYFDAFAPQFQPELWRFEVLNNFCKGLKKGGIFVTYSSKGQVRRDLEKAGIKVEKVPGPPGKREMIHGTKM